VQLVGELEPDAALTVIRMPPNHQTERIDAAHENRQRFAAWESSLLTLGFRHSRR
jgi:hypothetical protein